LFTKAPAWQPISPTTVPRPRAREVFSFHQPSTFQEWLQQPNTLRKRLQQFPALDLTGLRKCQERAIKTLTIVRAGRPKALVQWLTGSGKTYTAITSSIVSLNSQKLTILFLVDTKNLGEQAEQEFQAYTPNDDKRKFTELYGVQRLSSISLIAPARVCISTIQRMYSILKGEDLDESAEQESLFEITWHNRNIQDVRYNKNYPMEFFDIIIVDECHRSIYNLWRQVWNISTLFSSASRQRRTNGHSLFSMKTWFRIYP